MEIDDRARRELYESAEQALGSRGADVLMAHLPPVGWADVATKHDVAALVQRMDGIDARLGTVEQRLERLEGRMDTLNHTLVTAVVGSVLTATSIALAASHFV